MFGRLWLLLLVMGGNAQVLDIAELDKIVNQHSLPSLVVGVFVGGNNASCPALRLSAVAHGHRSLDRVVGRPPSALSATTASPYLWASASKTITHAALTMLLDQGIAGMDDDISTALGFQVRNPAYPDVPVRLRHFFVHATSLVDPTGDALDATYTYGGNCAPKKSLAKWFGDYVSRAESWGDWAPGDKSKYSNMGTGLEGLFVEKVSNTPFADFCTQNIFAPLGMESTSWLLSTLPDTAKAGAVPLFSLDDTGKLQEEQNYCFPDWPSGSLRSSVDDMLLFIAAVANLGEHPGGRLWTNETGAKVVSPFANEKGIQTGYGYGWSVSIGAFGRWVAGHEGQETGAATSVDLTPLTKQYSPATGTLYATNLDAGDAFRTDVAVWLQTALATAIATGFTCEQP
eukprot:Hpha_TRINITY_DN1958_c0_g1::TRINITY_DN1958_c0_g1_i1::g.31161::m.31161